MRHTTDSRLLSPTTVARPPLEEAGGAWALFGLLWVSAFLGLIIVPGGAVLATLMLLAACGWVLWLVLSTAGGLIKRFVVAMAVGIGKRKADKSRPVVDLSWVSPPSSPRRANSRGGVRNAARAR